MGKRQESARRRFRKKHRMSEDVTVLPALEDDKELFDRWVTRLGEDGKSGRDIMQAVQEALDKHPEWLSGIPTDKRELLEKGMDRAEPRVRYWTPKEDEFLKANYGRISVGAIGEYLKENYPPGRSIDSIQNRARRLRLTTPHTR